jgi:hypothetical protein
MIQDSSGSTPFQTIANQYANGIAWGGWRWIRDDATHANTGAQQILVNAATMAAGYEGAPVFVDELPVVDDNTTPGTCTPTVANPYCGVVADTQYEWEFLADAGVLPPFLEGLNEPNNFGFNYLAGFCGGTPSHPNTDYGPCVQAMTDIYTIEKADTLLNKPMVGMSEPGGEPNAVGAPNLVGQIFDWQNYHNYWTTATIGVGQLRIDNQVFQAFDMAPSATGQDTWGNYEGDVANGYTTWGAAHEPITLHDDVVGQFGGPIKVTTESGFNVYQCQNGQGNCTTRYTEAIAAVEGYMDGVLQGFNHIAQYEMMERDPDDGGWGFFNNNPTGDGASFNPSVMANEASCCNDGVPYSGAVMHNVTSILNDTQSVPASQLEIPAGYSVAGGAATTHSLLAQYSSVGQFPNKHVAQVWDESFAGVHTTVTVNFGSVVSYTVYDAFNGLVADSSGTASSVQVTVSGESAPMFVVF